MSKIPKELYITVARTSDIEYVKDAQTWVKTNEHLFGFLHPHEADALSETKRKADAARKQTQYNWAYASTPDSGLTFENGVWHREVSHWERDETGRHILIKSKEKIEEELVPRVWVNEPLSGFKIVDTVNRYRGNKLYKVQDPRGIQFEVTIKSMFKILMESTVTHGEIMAPCVWAGNKNLVVAE